MIKIVKDIFTDSKGRAEIKMLLGVPIVIVAVIYGFMTKDWVGFAAVAGFGSSLFITTAVADSALDKDA